MALTPTEEIKIAEYIAAETVRVCEACQKIMADDRLNPILKPLAAASAMGSFKASLRANVIKFLLDLRKTDGPEYILPKQEFDEVLFIINRLHK